MSCLLSVSRRSTQASSDVEPTDGAAYTYSVTIQCNLNKAHSGTLAEAASIFYLSYGCLGSDKNHSCSQDQKEWQSHIQTLKDQTKLN